MVDAEISIAGVEATPVLLCRECAAELCWRGERPPAMSELPGANGEEWWQERERQRELRATRRGSGVRRRRRVSHCW